MSWRGRNAALFMDEGLLMRDEGAWLSPLERGRGVFLHCLDLDFLLAWQKCAPSFKLICWLHLESSEVVGNYYLFNKSMATYP